MFFSVVIPAYNCAGTLAATVDSVLRSGLSDFEILVVNDGSTDGTAAVLDRLTREYPQITAEYQENGGVSSARNRGIARAKGRYLLFVDADDRIPERAFSEMRTLLEREAPDLLLFGMNFNYLYRSVCYRRETRSCSAEGLFRAETWTPMLPELFRDNYLSPVWNKFILRELVLRNDIRFRREMHVMEDCLFSLDCLSFADRIYLEPKPLYCYELQDEDRVLRRRMKRIDSLTGYMEHFSHLPPSFDEIRASVFYLMLQQRVSSADTAAELARVAAELPKAPFPPGSPEDEALCQALVAGKYCGLLFRNRYLRARHRAAVIWRSVGRRKPK